MSDEIKEFIEFRADEDGTYFYYIDKNDDEQWSYNLDNLKDYITNLQREIEKLNDDKRGMLVQLYKANDEKDKVKQENERKERLITQYGEGMCAYANRIDKAIEYCKSYSCWEDEDGTFHETDFCIDDLLNILQKGEENE